MSGALTSSSAPTSVQIGSRSVPWLWPRPRVPPGMREEQVMGGNPRVYIWGFPSAWLSSGICSKGGGCKDSLKEHQVAGTWRRAEELAGPSLWLAFRCPVAPKNLSPTGPVLSECPGSLVLILEVLVASDLSSHHILSLLLCRAGGRVGDGLHSGTRPPCRPPIGCTDKAGPQLICLHRTPVNLLEHDSMGGLWGAAARPFATCRCLSQRLL